MKGGLTMGQRGEGGSCDIPYVHDLLERFGRARKGTIAKLARDLCEGGDFERCLDLIQWFAM